MRYAALLALALLAGCGQTRTPEHGGPVYPESRAAVLEATAAVFRSRFTKLDSIDREAFVIQGTEHNWPGGDTIITVSLDEVAEGTRVNVCAASGPTASPAYNKHDRDYQNFLRWLDSEMETRRALVGATVPPPASAEQRIRELDSLHDKGLVTDDEYATKRKAIIDGL